MAEIESAPAFSLGRIVELACREACRDGRDADRQH
jgi:hypothetical protein